MSIPHAKNLLLPAVQSITWELPASCEGIAELQSTSFKTVINQQFGERVPVDQIPLCRISIPTLPRTAFAAPMLDKEAGFAYLFIYGFAMGKDWQGGGDYFDNVVNSVMAYFSGNNSPEPGPVAQTANDHIVGWGLSQEPRVEPPMRINNTLHYRATVAVSLLGFIV